MRKTELEGGCYVTHAGDLEFRDTANWSEASAIDRQTGANNLSLSLIRVATGTTPCRVYPDSEAVLYVLRGAGALTISGVTFPLTATTGACIQPGESFALTNVQETELELLVCVCPPALKTVWVSDMRPNFDARHPIRSVETDKQKMHETGNRFYQLLADEQICSGQITQFIGRIPQSKAKDHSHLYEETIVILSGEGYMWAGEKRARVRSGSIIYLPSRQSHCLECTACEGMTLVGHFYPAGSAAISY